MEDKVIYKDLSYQIVGVLFRVFNEFDYLYEATYYDNYKTGDYK